MPETKIYAVPYGDGIQVFLPNFFNCLWSASNDSVKNLPKPLSAIQIFDWPVYMIIWTCVLMCIPSKGMAYGHISCNECGTCLNDMWLIINVNVVASTGV